MALGLADPRGNDDVDERGGTAGECRAPLPGATLNDPQLQVAAQHPRRIENLISISFFLGLLCFGAFGAAFWQNWKPWTLGLSMGAGMALLGFGVISWGKYLMPRGPFVAG